MPTFHDLFPAAKAVIGVIHLPALPGYEGSPGIDAVIAKALADLAALEAGGADGVLVENEDDRPRRILSAAETTACMTRVTRELVLAARRCAIGTETLLTTPRRRSPWRWPRARASSAPTTSSIPWNARSTDPCASTPSA